MQWWVLFGHTNRGMFLNSMSEFKTIHMLLYFLLPPSCNPSLLHKRTQFSPCLMLANAPTLSQLLLVYISTISRLCSKEHSGLQKSTGGRPKKLSPSNICRAIHLISTQRAENAVLVTKTLSNIINQPLSPSTTCLHLKKAGMKAVVKTKHPLLSARHCKACLDFAHAHKDWTLDDWKRVVWSDETKVNCLGSDGCKWVWKKSGEGLSDRLVEGIAKFGGESIMIWGCMTWEGVGYAAKIDGRMDSDLCLQILSAG